MYKLNEISLQQATERLEKLVIAAEKMQTRCIASLWLCEAKVILQALKEKTEVVRCEDCRRGKKTTYNP